MTPSLTSGMRAEEAPLEPQLVIIDPHHHLWDNREGPAYLLEDFRADVAASGHNVVGSVFVECGWGSNTGTLKAPADEVSRVVASITSSSELEPQIMGIVGHLDLTAGRAVSRDLEDMITIAGGRLVGIRHSTAYDNDPAVPAHRSARQPGIMTTPAWRDGFAQFAKANLAFDAWVYHPQLHEVVALADDFPDVRIVVDHFGGPLMVGMYERHPNDSDRQWRSSLASLAERPNVYLKLGAVGWPATGVARSDDQPTSAALARRWGSRISFCIETFGTKRCMLESNFPVDGALYSYGAIWNGFKLICSGYGDDEKRDLFSETARSVYGL